MSSAGFEFQEVPAKLKKVDFEIFMRRSPLKRRAFFLRGSQQIAWKEDLKEAPGHFAVPLCDASVYGCVLEFGTQAEWLEDINPNLYDDVHRRVLH